MGTTLYPDGLHIPQCFVQTVSTVVVSTPSLHRTAHHVCADVAQEPLLWVPYKVIAVAWHSGQSSGAVWKSRWMSWAPVPSKPTVSVDIKQHFIIMAFWPWGQTWSSASKKGQHTHTQQQQQQHQQQQQKGRPVAFKQTKSPRTRLVCDFRVGY